MSEYPTIDETLCRSLFDALYDAVIIHDLDGNILEVNEAALRMYGATRETFRRYSMVEQYSAYRDSEGQLEEYWRRCRDGEPQLFEWRARRPHDGSEFDVEVYLSRVPNGSRTLILAMVRDITERQTMVRELRLFQRVFDNAIEGIAVTDADGTIVSVNPAFTTITGYSAEEAIGRNPRILKSDRHDKAFYQEMWDSLIQHGQWSGEIWNRRKDGEAYPEWLNITAIGRDASDPLYYVSVFHDITEMKRKEKQIRYQALHDALTGLPNRVLFQDRLQVSLKRAEREPFEIAVVFFDLDNFKNINDSLGHSAGDLLLQQLAQRIGGVVRSEDTLGRLGGDEFVMMIAAPEVSRVAVEIVERLLRSLEKPFRIGGQELFVTVSIGLAFYPRDARDAEELVVNADLAMYRAKHQGKNQYEFYSAEMNAPVHERLELEFNLRRAIEREEFTIVLHPKLEVGGRRLTGMEALVRWRRPDGVQVPPDRFIPVAEDAGLIDRIDIMVLEQTCNVAREFVACSDGELRVAVNLSSRHLYDPYLVEQVLGVLQRTGFPAENLELEVTETALMLEIERAAAKLAELASHRIHISIDDFGTGYSSLYYLKKLPVDCVKIDRSFVADLDYNSDDAEIVAGIIAMAQNLRLRVVAEGVETQQQLEYLQRQGCDEVQGYYLSRPLSPPDFERFLLERS